MRRAEVWLVAASLLVASRAQAYRPFDGTDADVADPGDFELELGPAHAYTLNGQRFVIAPATVLNFGLGYETELVVDFRNFVALGPLAPGTPRMALRDTDIFLKHVLRRGCLQGDTGLSVATEGGPLVPEIEGESGLGASLAVIGSYRSSWGTVHANETFAYSRAHHPDGTSGVIVEGPYDWRVRPVGEVSYEREVGVADTRAALLGALWTPSDSFVVDAAVRGALIDDARAYELRLGFTWTMAMAPSAGAAARVAKPLARR